MKKKFLSGILILTLLILSGQAWAANTYYLRADGTAARRSMSALASCGTNCTRVTTTAATGLVAGASVVITNTTPSYVNGTWTAISASDANPYTVDIPVAYSTGYTSGGIVMAAGPCPGTYCTASGTVSLSAIIAQNSYILPDDMIYLSASGGDYTGQLTPAPGTAGHLVTYSGVPGESPYATISRAGAGTYGVLANPVSYFKLQHLNITGATTWQVGVVNSTGAVIDYCNITQSNGGGGVTLTGTGGSHTLSNSTVTASDINHSSLAAVNINSPSAVVSGNTIINSTAGYDYSYGVGLALLNSSAVVSGCVIGGDSSGTGFLNNIQVSNGVNNTIQGNEIKWAWNGLDYNNAKNEVGISLTGSAAAGNIVEKNYIHHNRRGWIEHATVTGDGVNIVRYNLFYNNGTNAIDTRYATGTGYPKIYNNTVIHHVKLDDAIESATIGHGIACQGCRGFEARNNIIVVDQLYAAVQGMYIYDPNGSTLVKADLSNNLYWTTNGAHAGTSGINSVVTQYDGAVPSWAGIDAVTTKDTGSVYANPQLVSSTDLNLQSSSPSINAGTLITGVHTIATPATDYVGTSITTLPDIGAYEYSVQDLYFDSAASAGGNGTRSYPYHLFADYSAWAGYAVRSGSNIYVSGTLATGLDLSSLTELPTKVSCKRNKACLFPLTGTAVPISGFQGQSMMSLPGR